MEGITSKSTRLQEVEAEAVLSVSKRNTVQAILEKRVPKGDVLEMARVAGLFAVKNTHLILPHIYPSAIEFAAVDYQITDFEIHISIQISSVGKSSLEVNAMHGASITALTVYDMLKPIDKEVSIVRLAMVEKSDKYNHSKYSKRFDAALVLCSNAVVKGIKSDTAGQAILEKLKSLNADITSYNIIPDDLELIREHAKSLAKENQLLVFSGGTGLSKTDLTTEALLPILDRRIPGIAEAMRSYGQVRTPYAMFSRSLAGMIGNCLVLAIPGSTRGAEESMDAVFPDLLHALK
ncbi:bifunctional molybdenum cofactor biosynthesis protein MoaC/MoaB [Algoriphagus aestuariicola]|uniref:Bifunctional molybdenum cofactor biosynthesis protein MoaC/MoaB n=1 Tax=Algoriphagus aestuariicola TaxID=1852016 RepID=A0ABS3BPP2_9BACT|nr:bifunctional molybdenum cofactor biosynthesis protein MoaC/MoaB [Algoriphagus aestuariicola]MBN7801264.1 bifunctional molybdenum cofactor biosynthesis protein MoaC/MoaB [Algoriphagus aestuariicola]